MVGLVVWPTFTMYGPLVSLDLLYTPTAMIFAQAIIASPIVTDLPWPPSSPSNRRSTCKSWPWAPKKPQVRVTYPKKGIYLPKANYFFQGVTQKSYREKYQLEGAESWPFFFFVQER